MLSEKYTELNQRKQLEFNNLSKEIVPWLEDLALETNCKIERKEWKANITAMLFMIMNRFARTDSR